MERRHLSTFSKRKAEVLPHQKIVAPHEDTPSPPEKCFSSWNEESPPFDKHTSTAKFSRSRRFRLIKRRCRLMRKYKLSIQQKVPTHLGKYRKVRFEAKAQVSVTRRFRLINQKFWLMAKRSSS
ncbi:hypothetical protein U1Q18_052555 [Sarracenia purpurea var. burkii]